jgi:hypothetical protein
MAASTTTSLNDKFQSSTANCQSKIGQLIPGVLTIEIIGFSIFMTLIVICLHNFYYYLWKQNRIKVVSMSFLYFTILVILLLRATQSIYLIFYRLCDQKVLLIG